MEELFNEAHTIFLNIMKHGEYKFKYLPQSTLFKAKQFQNEVKENPQRYFPKFKRGAIIYVKFGINIGSEMSGNHFAIVLDKYDKETKSTLTVVPLSSKNKSYYQKLLPHDNVYIKNSLYHLDKLNNLISKWESESKNYLLEIGNKKIYYMDEFKLYVTQLLLENNGIMNEDIREKIDIFSEKSVKTALYKISEGHKNFLDSKDKHFKGIKKYEKYKDKDSYACINMIQTIDKRKLSPISVFESIGNIFISGESMELIEKRIQKMYFTFDK